MHELRKKNNRQNKDKRQPVPLEDHRLYPRIDLQASPQPKPDTQECLERKQHLEACHPLLSYRTKDLRDHIEPCDHDDDQCRWHDAADTLGDTASGLGILFGTQVFLHTHDDKVVCDQKSPIDKCCHEVNSFDNNESHNAILGKNEAEYNIC